MIPLPSYKHLSKMHSPAVENNALEHRKWDIHDQRAAFVYSWLGVLQQNCYKDILYFDCFFWWENPFYYRNSRVHFFFLTYLCKLEAVRLPVHPSKAVSNFCLLFSFTIRFWDELSLAKLNAFQRCITCICRWRKIATIRTFTEPVAFTWPFVLEFHCKNNRPVT